MVVRVRLNKQQEAGLKKLLEEGLWGLTLEDVILRIVDRKLIERMESSREARQLKTGKRRHA